MPAAEFMPCPVATTGLKPVLAVIPVAFTVTLYAPSIFLLSDD
jgi:hypothetical protein